MIEKNSLTIDNLHVKTNDKNILNGLNLSINCGEIHAIMGQNGSGKSTLAKVIAGHPNYKVVKGDIYLNEENITYLEADVRAHKGIFLGFQYPIEIPGVTNADFLRLAYNSRKNFNQELELDPLSFFDLVNEKIKNIDMDTEFLNRNVNEGFSGGEKKKNEILQMSLFDNCITILDEIDSGLDIDALKNIANNINGLKSINNSLLLITHYKRLLDYIKPHYVHIMEKGKIIHTGDINVASQIEQHGYNFIK